MGVNLVLALFAGAVVVLSLFSTLFQRLSLPGPLLALAFGVLIGPLRTGADPHGRLRGPHQHAAGAGSTTHSCRRTDRRRAAAAARILEAQPLLAAGHHRDRYGRHARSGHRRPLGGADRSLRHGTDDRGDHHPHPPSGDHPNRHRLAGRGEGPRASPVQPLGGKRDQRRSGLSVRDAAHTADDQPPQLHWWAPIIVIAAILGRRLVTIWTLRPLFRTLHNRPQTFFLSWFAPIGVSALFYATLAEKHTGNPEIFTYASLAITASVLIHGLSAAPISAWLKRHQSQSSDEAEAPSRIA